MYTRILLFVSSVFLLSACSNTSNQLELVSLDLSPYGIPFSVMAPDSAIVKEDDSFISKDVTIKLGEDFDVMIQIQDATNADFASFRKEQEDLITAGRYFSKMVSSDEKGFIYENQVDSAYVNYGFRYLILQDGKEFIFQSGLTGNYDLELVEMMYDAVKQ